ncbi:MAG TPA: NnrU family protein [Candidatus Binatia bacterium]|nr:NnrU family protein [Candidatus Binatia bacterium]
MEPSLAVALWWLVFGGTHVGLATAPARRAIVDRIGQRGFEVLYVAVAVVSFAGLMHAFAVRRFAGAPGLALASVEPVRWLLLAVSFAGVALAALSFAAYPRSPYPPYGARVRPPYGVERITRHPFFAGIGMLAAAHALLATHLVGTVFFAGLLVFLAFGVRHQERKIRAQRGPAYDAYAAATSTVPFAAVLAGRQRIAWHEIGWRNVATAAAVALALRLVHSSILAAGGAYAVAVVVAGAGLLTLQALRRARRDAAPELALSSR